ncbi:MAG: neutral/alkaline non-lysosomal ceramidase N-terminal domain-containing protein [Sandaracinaceae bacterium]|nr:neutral/alkaline non-lysosomal ceramidase N-terminal domain-containing protein [Sandaracinaceae bacterium]
MDVRAYLSGLGACLLALGSFGCDGTPMPEDAGMERTDAGPPVPASTEHCAYEAAPPTGGAGGTVTSGPLMAGTAEALLDLPLGTAVGSYTARAETLGNAGFLPAPDQRHTDLAVAFAPSVGIETIPRIRGLALSSGGESVVILKVDLSLSYQGFVHDVERALGPEFSGKVIVATSHSHSSFGDYTGHSGLKLGFSEFRNTVYSALVTQLTEVARAALADLQPAQIGFHLDPEFDLTNAVNRDRRGEDDVPPGSGGPGDQQLFMIRVDTEAGEPMAMLPVFGIHGTIHSEDNVLISTDSIGGIERVLEESFDTPVLVMHLQGAGGDTSPAGQGSTNCSGVEVCADFGRPETVGIAALSEIREAYDAAGAAMQGEVALEMLTRTVPLGPDWTTFRIRDGGLEYTPWDATTYADGEVYDSSGNLISPIDEFNAPFGAALCGNGETAGLHLQRAALRGSDTLREYSYYNCLRVDQIVGVLRTLFSVEIEDAPICETTTTTVSALRIGDWMIGTLPGEPVQDIRNLVQELSPVAADHTIVVGYSQDHGGYLLRPENWLAGGYEPSISFWGPLEGEYVAEQTAAVMALAATPEREDGNAGGVPHPVVPMVTDDIPLDDAPLAGTVPETMPDYLLAHRFQTLASLQPPPTIERIDNAFFTWIGDDPLRGTPRITIERETAPDTWETVVRRSGRPVQDGDILLTWTPNPILRQAGVPRTHYYTAEFQVAAPMGMSGLEAVEDRRGFPAGTYRFHVVHPNYTVNSDPFEVVPATLDAAVETSGSDATVTLSFENVNGYRLLDVRGARSNEVVPIRDAAVEVTVGMGAPMSLMTNADGQVTVPGGVGNIVIITDAFGNTVTVNP